MKKTLTLILFFIILTLSPLSLADKPVDKTIVVVVDEIDFKTSKEISNNKLSMGLLNIKTTGKNLESLFMTINSGRKVSISYNQFNSIVRRDNKVIVDGYKNIIKELDKNYPNFSKQISFLGEELQSKDVKTSFIGSEKSSEILIIADKKGRVNYWDDETQYSKDKLIDQAEDMLRISDCLVISFNIDNNSDRVRVLESFLKEMEKYNLVVFPKTVSGDLTHALNNSLVPIFYSDNESEIGTLTSKSTKRDSVVTSLDLSPTILNFYDLKVDSNIGNKLEVVKDTNLIETNKNVLEEFINLNIIKYIFHAIVVFLSIYISYMVFMKKKDFRLIKIFLNTVILSILLSVVFGIFHLHRSTLLYGGVLLFVSFLISTLLEKRKIRVIEVTSILTNILILLFAFLKPNVLYNSFIGYNSIVAGGRFYGFNNEIMGVLIVTSVIVYYQVKNLTKRENSSNLFLIIYFPIVILALSGGFGANFGGFLTSISVLLILLYQSLFNRKINKKTIISLLAIGILILVSNLYVDIKNDIGSHAGNLIERISLLGFYEFIDMIIKKVKQLLFMLIVPPWSLAFLAQIYIILFKFREIKKFQKNIPMEFVVMFISSLIALLINDTGVVAFMYMNIYLINKIIEE